MSAPSSTLSDIGTSSPFARIIAGYPTERWRSEPLSSSSLSKSVSMAGMSLALAEHGTKPSPRFLELRRRRCLCLLLDRFGSVSDRQGDFFGNRARGDELAKRILEPNHSKAPSALKQA